MKIPTQVSLSLVRNVSHFLDFFQELIENIFVGFVVVRVAMTTATATRKKIGRAHTVTGAICPFHGRSL